MLSHGCISGELGVGTDEHYAFLLAFPHNGIEIAYLASVLLVKRGVGHTHNFLKRVVITEEATFFCYEILFRAEIRSTVYRESGRCPWREARGGLPEEHNNWCAIFLGSIKRGGYWRGVNVWGGRFLADLITGGAVFSVRHPSRYLSRWGCNFITRCGDAFAWNGRCCGSRNVTRGCKGS